MTDPYRTRSPLETPDRIDARRLLDTNVYARAFHDSIASIYLGGGLTVAEMRILFTMGLEYGMMREVKQHRFVLGDSTAPQPPESPPPADEPAKP